MVRASASRLVGVGFIPLSSQTKRFKKLVPVFAASLLDVQRFKGIVWRTSWQVCLLSPTNILWHRGCGNP